MVVVSLPVLVVNWQCWWWFLKKLAMVGGGGGGGGVMAIHILFGNRAQCTHVPMISYLLYIWYLPCCTFTLGFS